MEAEERRSHNAYLFDLDHFIVMHHDADQNEALPPMPAFARGLAVPDAADVEHLVVDAERSSNIGRFFNHSCEPNMIVQPVLTRGCSALAYRIAFVASRDVEAGTELCYNYGARYFFKDGDEVLACCCGAPSCGGHVAVA